MPTRASRALQEPAATASVSSSPATAWWGSGSWRPCGTVTRERRGGSPCCRRSRAAPMTGSRCRPTSTAPTAADLDVVAEGCYDADGYKLRLGEAVTADRPGRPHRHHQPRREPRLRRAGAGHRLLPVRPAGARQGSARLLRLPHARRPRRDPRRRRSTRPRHPRQAGRPGGRRRAARPGGGARAAPARHVPARRGAGPAADAAAGRRGRRRPAARDDRGAGRHRAPGHLGRLDHGGTGHGCSPPWPNGTELDLDVVVFSAGVRPRDQLARDAGPGRRRARRRGRRRRLPHQRSGHLRHRRVRLRRRPGLRPGRARLRDGRGAGRPAHRRHRQLHRRRHLHQAQAAGRRRRQLRRRARRIRRRARGDAQQPGRSAATPSSSSPTTPRPCSAGSSSATPRNTRCCGRWSGGRSPATR